LVSLVVAMTGLIGFVGLVIPHIARLLFGPCHVRLVPASLLLGAVFMPLVDMLCRTAVAPAELPIGLVTALTGTPFFIYLLVYREGRA
jgi:iron complex transport system permease protein